METNHQFGFLLSNRIVEAMIVTFINSIHSGRSVHGTKTLVCSLRRMFQELQGSNVYRMTCYKIQIQTNQVVHGIPVGFLIPFLHILPFSIMYPNTDVCN